MFDGFGVSADVWNVVVLILRSQRSQASFRCHMRSADVRARSGAFGRALGRRGSTRADVRAQGAHGVLHFERRPLVGRAVQRVAQRLAGLA